MTLATLLKVNLALALLPASVHVGSILIDNEPGNVIEGVLLLSLDLSVIGTSILGLFQPALIWRVLSYQSVLLVLASSSVIWVLVLFAIRGPTESFSVTIGLPTLLCVYTAYLAKRVAEHYLDIRLRYLLWFVGIAVGLIEVLVYLRLSRIVMNGVYF